jgi:tRNA-2-methylthio-N6-dimethylallyladenosine synthase
VEWQLPVAGEPAEPHTETQLISALVPVSYGCDHHCTYCIVRLRRGKQDSRPVHEILRDAQSWLQRRAREIVLLGQNVDAYGQDRAPGHADLADLLRSVHRLDGLARLRFLTSHPAHMSQKLIDTVTALPKACPHLELPVQSGDDDILHRMRRGYTVADYVALLERIRAGVPSCSIATDVIVGFPGESAAQFQRTYDLIAHGRFDAVHIAKFSPRAGTPAARLVDSVSSEEKESRRRSLEQLQEGIAASINAELLGQQVEVLVEGQSRGKWMGRTATNKLVFFAHRDAWRGELARVEITWTGPWSLQGRLVDRPCEGTQPQSEPPEGVSVVPSAGR